MSYSYDYPEHLITQVILAAQARGEDPTDAAISAAEAYASGLAAFEKMPLVEDANSRYLREAAGCQQVQTVGGESTALSRSDRPRTGAGNARGITSAPE